MKQYLITAVCALALTTALTLPISAADAKENWTKHCAKCHGEDGKGDTKMGKKLKVKDYTDAKVQGEMKDDKMAVSIRDGVKEDTKVRMKAHADLLADAEIQALVQFIRSLKK